MFLLLGRNKDTAVAQVSSAYGSGLQVGWGWRYCAQHWCYGHQIACSGAWKLIMTPLCANLNMLASHLAADDWKKW